MCLNKDRGKNAPVDDKMDIWMCVFLIPHQELLHLCVRYVLYPSVCACTDPRGIWREEIAVSMQSPLATHLPNAGRQLWVTIHMLWTMGWPLWAACGLEDKGHEFPLPEAICMWIVDDCGLLMHTRPQIIKDWSQAEGLGREILPNELKALSTDSFCTSLHSQGTLPCDAVIAWEEEMLSWSPLTFKN